MSAVAVVNQRLSVDVSAIKQEVIADGPTVTEVHMEI